MTLSQGTRLGPYEVLSLLGTGGMGEVYRAKDTRLSREVAIKVLPAELSSDRQRLARFELEARTVSSLNHPHIVTLYDIGTSDSVSYIAMELLDGQTLREALESDALPIRKLLQVAAQVADGLAKAHASGIVHRDLKPENVMVTYDGFAKILDFGLARLTERDDSGANLSQAPTTPMPTEPGVVMGTVGYMSPEQAMGKSVDFRSDQFSFGSMLYEMATGKRAFSRATAPETLSAIIRDEPEPMGSINPQIPTPLRWIVERCLAKDPEERYASTRDLGRDLQMIRDHLSEPTPSGAAAPIPAFRTRWRSWQLAAASFALLLVVAVGAFVAVKRAGEASSPRFKQLTFRRGSIRSARFAPDGQTVVYGAAYDGNPIEIFTSRLGSPESRPLGFPGASLLSISPSGEMAIFVRNPYGHETLARVPLAGGAPRELRDDVRDAEWASDGKELAIVRWVGGRDQLEVPPGKPIDSSKWGIGNLRISPRSDEIAYVKRRSESDSEVWLSKLAGNPHPATSRTFSSGGAEATSLAWSSDGTRLWFGAADQDDDGTSLYVVGLSGKPRLALRVAGRFLLQDISRDGKILVKQVIPRSGIIGLFPGESKERELSWFARSSVRGLSPDGRTILFQESLRDRNPLIYLRRTDGSSAVRLGEGRPQALSPDGEWVLSISRNWDSIGLLATGPGTARSLPPGPLKTYSKALWLPNGKEILFSGEDKTGSSRLYVQDLGGGDPRPITDGGVGLLGYAVAVSPDGKTVVAIGPDNKIWLYPLAGGTPLPINGIAAGAPIGWSMDGSLYVSGGATLERHPARVYRLDPSTGQRRLLKEIEPPDTAGLLTIGPVFLTPDGKSYAYTYHRELSDLYVIEGLK